ncbi:hypothetical protein RsY01_1150 [Lactococcus reticulitermitis]|uniref:Uncharacterized protein n=1 Tax=Pseudolactococcus reticulitermitis TaxID=2025039 RepID=A0A224X8A6_9LACT|nr:hypothetical protein RsY01_1150 [Lactococcus reticulitermitis]
MNSDTMLKIIFDCQDSSKRNGVAFSVAGYLSKKIVKTLNDKEIKCIIHYNSIPEIFGREIAHPNHLANIKKLTKAKMSEIV